jgi:hypothetical protein
MIQIFLEENAVVSRNEKKKFQITLVWLSTSPFVTLALINGQDQA